MTDAEYSATKKRIQKLYDKWSVPMGLSWWRSVDLCYSRDPLTSEHGAQWHANARVSVKWEYMDAQITFSMPDCMNLDDEELEKTVVHELCHALVNEMREWCTVELPDGEATRCMRHEERVVCALAAAFIWVRKDGEGKLVRPPKQLKAKDGK